MQGDPPAMVFEHTDQGMSVFDANLRLRFWNRRFAQLIDLPDALASDGVLLEAIVRHVAERSACEPDRVDTLVAERVALMAKRQAQRIAYTCGDALIESCVTPLPDGGLAITYADVTASRRHLAQLQAAAVELEQRFAERNAALQHSEERFRDLAEVASDWFWETDDALRFTYVSDSYFISSGLPQQAVIGRRRWEIPTINDYEMGQRLEANRQDMLARRAFRVEYSVTAPDGTPRHYRVSGRPVFGPGHVFLGYRGVGSDITQLVIAQEKLIASEKMAALGGLVAGVAHEINTPIGIGLTAATHLEDQIRAFRRLYAEGRMKRSDLERLLDLADDALGSLITDLRRAGELVRGFKQVAVDQSSEMRRRFNLQQYLAEVLVSLRPRLKSVTVDVTCPDDIELDSYPGVYSQIITNLVINSLLHGFPPACGGRINITAQREGAWLWLRYGDDGQGMSEEVRRRVFEPFFTTRRGQGGSGLGMHVVYNLVTQKLQGAIELVSTPGAGMQVAIHVPISLEIGHEASR